MNRAQSNTKHDYAFQEGLEISSLDGALPLAIASNFKGWRCLGRLTRKWQLCAAHWLLVSLEAQHLWPYSRAHFLCRYFNACRGSKTTISPHISPCRSLLRYINVVHILSRELSIPRLNGCSAIYRDFPLVVETALWFRLLFTFLISDVILCPFYLNVWLGLDS